MYASETKVLSVAMTNRVIRKGESLEEGKGGKQRGKALSFECTEGVRENE